MNNDKIINAIKSLETVQEQHKAFTVDLLPKLNKDASGFELSKVRPTYTAKVLFNLLDLMQQSVHKDEAKAAFIMDSRNEIYTIYFKTMDEALYAKRKFKKIARLAFTQKINFSIEEVKAA